MLLEGIDLFCGAGGTTTGVHEAKIDGKSIAKVVACINHDENAIASHKANHPEALHFIEDIREFDVKYLPKKNPDAYSFIWASLECTHFSNAKGGQSRKADSRTLAEHLYRYIDKYNPHFIKIENVKEFLTWGPLRVKLKKTWSYYSELALDKKGNPIWIPDPQRKSEFYERWRDHICEQFGYEYDYRLLNAADYGAYTSRIRYFGCFAKKGLPIAWPIPTYSKKGNDGLKKWKAVKDVLNLDVKGESIFNRKKPLAENTLKRIYAGLVKYIAKGEDSFIKKYFSGRPAGKVISINGPAGTVTTIDHQTLVQPEFFVKYYGCSKAGSIESPSPTITTKDRLALISTDISDHDSENQYLMNPQYNCKGKDLDTPCFTLIARMDKMPPYLVSPTKGIGLVDLDGEESETMRLIKLFMAAHGIIDIKMRMLQIPELKRIQGFGSDYMLEGNKSQQKKYIGNAVVPVIPKVWYEAIAHSLIEMNQSRNLKQA